MIHSVRPTIKPAIPNKATMSAKPAFKGCAIKGTGAIEFLTKKKAKEGFWAVDEFHKFCDNLTNWGYVNINKTEKPNVYELQANSNYLTTKFNSNNTSLHDLKVKLEFLKENKGIIDQG